MARVVSVNISEKKGTLKKPVPEIELKLRHGIVGDAHAGDWHRQISLLAEESIDTMRALTPRPAGLRHFRGEHQHGRASTSNTCRWAPICASERRRWR